MDTCKYCGREAKSKNSNTQHEIRCNFNPDKIEVTPSYGMLGKKGSNQYIKGTAKPISEETRKKKSLATTIQNNKRWADPQNRIQQSERMKMAVQEHPESYRSSNRGRVKQIEFDGIKFHGRWELDFYKWCKSHNITVVRNELWFDYEWNGNRKYNPDFYLPEYDWFVEVKGYKTERDDAKWSQFPKTLKVVSSKEIKEIRKNTYVLQ